MSRLTKTKGSLTYDDRVDVLSFAVAAYWVDQMARDADQAVYDRKQDKLRVELDNFMKHNVFHKKSEKTWVNI